MSQFETNKSLLKVGVRVALTVALLLNPVLNQAAIAPIALPKNQILHPSTILKSEMSATQKNAKPISRFEYSMIRYDIATREMDLQETARIALQMQKEAQFDPSEIIPLNMPEQSSDSGYVAGKVLRHSLENWYDSSGLKKSDWGRATSGLNDQIEHSLKSSTGDSPFSVKMRAITGRAQIKYKGAVEAALTYEAFENEAKLEVVRHLDPTTTLVFHSIENSRGHHSEIGLRWSF